MRSATVETEKDSEVDRRPLGPVRSAIAAFIVAGKRAHFVDLLLDPTNTIDEFIEVTNRTYIFCFNSILAARRVLERSSKKGLVDVCKSTVSVCESHRFTQTN